jgi:lipoprotein signal peptidase
MSEAKQRNVYLSAWLVLLLVCNLMAAALYLIPSLAMGQGILSEPRWLFPVLAVVAIANAGCAYALFMWKKWGFYGLLVAAAVSITVNLINGATVFHASLGLVGVAILFILLHIGTGDNGWRQLE